MIFIKGLTKITDEKYSIGNVYLKPLDPVYGLNQTKEQLEQEGILIDDVPFLPFKDGTVQVLYYNPVTKTGLYEYENLVPEITLDDAKNSKIQELEDLCNNAKLQEGFTSSCLGAPKKFSSTELNRNLIIGLSAKASLIKSGATLPDISLDWKSEDEEVCYPWTADQIIMLGVDLSTFMTNTIKHKEQLQSYVRSLTTIEEVQKVTWDTSIPTTTT